MVVSNKRFDPDDRAALDSVIEAVKKTGKAYHLLGAFRLPEIRPRRFGLVTCLGENYASSIADMRYR